MTAAFGATDTVCFHCGQVVTDYGKWRVLVDEEPREMCCPGCAAVAQAIVDQGLADYYRTRTQVPDRALIDEVIPSHLLPPGERVTTDASSLLKNDSSSTDYARYDLPAVQARFVRKDPQEADLRETTLLLEGLRCGACVWLIEQALQRISGVCDVRVNYALQRLYVRWQASEVALSAIFQAIARLGYRAVPFDQQSQQQQLEQARKRLLKQLFVAGIGMMQVMMYAIPVYLAEAGSIDWEYEHLMRWASLLLTLPVVLYAAQDFFRGAWRDLCHRRLGMDVPVALGIGAAFIASSSATWQQSGQQASVVYFDSITMFIFLLLAGRYWELRAREKALAQFQNLSQAHPAVAHRFIDYPQSHEVALVAVAELAVGDYLLVRPGETVPTDLLLLEKSVRLDLALLTGESTPVEKAVNEEIPGGAVNLEQPLLGQVLRVSSQSLLSTIEQLAEKALYTRPQLAAQADRVAAWFVVGLLLLTGLVYVFWRYQDPSRALAIAIALLVVSCPCALSLATPTALAASISALLRMGILVSRSQVLENWAKVTDFVFDKTGTLTTGKMVLGHAEYAETESSEKLLAVVAALEAHSEHPIARALRQAASCTEQRHEAAAMMCSEVQNTPGQGIEGLIQGERYRIGCLAYVQELVGRTFNSPFSLNPHLAATTHARRATTQVWLGAPGRWLATFYLTDTLRPGVRELIQYLQQQGIRTHLLSGDGRDPVHQVATDLHLPLALAQQSPAQKLEYVQRLQHQGRCVAMLGDGVNDAPVVGGADVALAMAQGAYLAQTRADVILLAGDFTSLACGLQHARRTMQIIRQNLYWAMGYNLIAIPAAAFGWVSPWLAGVGMSLSSILVVANAARLLHYSDRR